MLRSKTVKNKLGKWFLTGSPLFEKYYVAKNTRLARLSEAQGHRCVYCLRPTWLFGEEPQPWHRSGNQATLEHLHERVNGGHSNWENTVMACQQCNTGRSSMWTAVEYHKKKQHLRDRLRKAAA